MHSQKAINMKTKLIILILSFFFAQGAIAQNFTKEKSYYQSYLAEKYTELHISNKYGDIRVFPSENDSIIFKVHLSASDKKEYEAEEQLMEMDVQFSKSAYIIQVSSVFNGNENNFKTDFKMFTKNVFNSPKNIRIDYEIYVPQGLSIHIDNAYGNVVVNEYVGNVDITLSGGDLIVGVLEGKTKIDMRGGTLRARAIEDATILVDMTQVNIDSMAKAYIESRGAQIDIQAVDNLSVESKRDKFMLQSVGKITGSGNFSTFNIEMLNDECVLKTFFGDVSIKKIGPEFTRLSLIASSGDISIGIPTISEPSIQCEIEKTRTVFPSTLNLQSDTLDVKTEHYKYYNNPVNPTQFINLNITGGSLTLY